MLASLFLFLISTTEASEVEKAIELNDGTVVVGVVIDEGDAGYLVKTAAGEVVRVPYDQVQNVSVVQEIQSSSAHHEEPQSDPVRPDKPQKASETMGARNWAFSVYVGGLLADGPLQFRFEHNEMGGRDSNLSDSRSVTSILGIGSGVFSVGVAFRQYGIGNNRSGVALDAEAQTIWVDGYSGFLVSPAIAIKLALGSDPESWSGLVLDGRVGAAFVTDFSDVAAVPTLNFGVGFGF